jgi:hypothetical protein
VHQRTSGSFGGTHDLPITPDLTLDGLKKEAKLWLKAIHAKNATARAKAGSTAGRG